MSRRHFLTIPILIFFLMYAVISTDSLCRCQLRTPPVVPACPSHITSLYGPDQYSDPHPCTSLDLPHHITVSMSAPWHFLLWHICSTHRLLMRISDGCQDSFRPSGRSENFAFGSLLPFVFLQQYKPCFHLKLCCHSESEKGFYFHSVSSYSYTYASYDELCLSSFLPRKRPYPSIFTLDAGFFFNCFTV